MLVKQQPYEPGLYQDNRRGQANLPGIPLPRRQFLEMDFAVWREAVLADAPALHLPPIEHRLAARDLRKALQRHRTSQKLQNHPGGLSAMGGETIQASPYDPAAEILIDKAI